MYPDPIKPDDVVTPWFLKWIFLPFIAGFLLLSIAQDQIKSWKCSREAKRQGYLRGQLIPGGRFGNGRACVCEDKLLPNGEVDTKAKLTIDLENRNLSW